MVRISNALCISSALIGMILFSLNVHADNIVADSVADFSDVQGQNGWYYGYVDIAASPAFVQMPTFFPAWGYGITVPAWAIDSPTPGGTNYFTMIDAMGSQPNGLVTSGFEPREQWTDRRWISDTAGNVDISGIIGDYGDFETSSQDGDGVIYEVLVDGTLVWDDGTNGSTPNHPYSFVTQIHKGSVVDFVTMPRVSDFADGNVFTASIVHGLPEPPSVELLALSVAGLLGMGWNRIGKDSHK